MGRSKPLFLSVDLAGIRFRYPELPQEWKARLHSPNGHGSGPTDDVRSGYSATSVDNMRGNGHSAALRMLLWAGNSNSTNSLPASLCITGTQGGSSGAKLGDLRMGSLRRRVVGRDDWTSFLGRRGIRAR